MKKISKEKVKRIEDYVQANINITQYVKEHKLGAIINDKMECPFHDDLSPSMYIDSKRNIYKCFSCGRGGGPISFHMHYRNVIEGRHLNYYEAIDDLMRFYPIIKADTNITTVFQQQDLTPDLTQPVELRQRFRPTRLHTTNTTQTLEQTVKAIRNRNNTEEILDFINDCINEKDEKVLASTYKTGRQEKLTIEELML